MSLASRSGGTPGPSSLHFDDGFAGVVAIDAHHAAAAVLGGVFREIAHGARDFARAAFAHHGSRRLGADVDAHVLQFAAERARDFGEIDVGARFFAGAGARERERLLGERSISSTEREQALALGFVFDQFGAQADRGDRRAQIVAERPEHLALAVELAAEPLGHGVERGGGAAHVVRAADGRGDIGLA